MMTDLIENEDIEQLDARGLTCPLPLLKMKQALNCLPSGTLLKVIATDRGSMRDFKAFAKMSDHQLLEARQEQDCYYYLFKKA